MGFLEAFVKYGIILLLSFVVSGEYYDWKRCATTKRRQRLTFLLAMTGIWLSLIIAVGVEVGMEAINDR